jgi:magnesium transporter
MTTTPAKQRGRHAARRPSARHGAGTLVGEATAISATLASVVQPAETTVQAPLLAIWRYAPEQPLEPIALAEIDVKTNDAHTFYWIDATAYTSAEIDALMEKIPLHHFVRHSLFSPWQRPLLADYHSAFFLSATVPHLTNGQERLHASELTIYVGERFILTAHKLPLPFMERVQSRLQQPSDAVPRSPIFVLYLLLDELLAHYESINHHIQHESEIMEERALHETKEQFLEDLLRFKRYTFAVMELVDDHREVVQAFFRPDFHWIATEESESYFRDVQARLAHLLGQLAGAKESVNGAFTIYVSQMSHRTNQIIKVLTMVSTVLLPATLIIALFGASIETLVPRFAGVWFAIMLAAIMLITGGILFAFRQQRWLDWRRTK